MEKLTDRKKAAISGALAGVVNGFFGGGGGMLLVPMLTRWLKLEERRAFATSVCVIFPMCAASAAVYLFRAQMDYLATLPYLLGGLLGGLIAGRVFKKIPTTLLRRALALFIICGGARSLFWS